MSQMTRSVCELLPSAACDLYARPPEPVDSGPQRQDVRPASPSRASLKQYLLDPVLPMLTLLSMSALTVVLLVTIVTAVADMDMRLPNSYVNVDPWADVSVGRTGGFYPEQSAYADLAGPWDDREFRPAPQSGNPF
jgi:hypothetical protein